VAARLVLEREQTLDLLAQVAEEQAERTLLQEVQEQQIQVQAEGLLVCGRIEQADPYLEMLAVQEHQV
jgi:hypothetical protein